MLGGSCQCSPDSAPPYGLGAGYFNTGCGCIPCGRAESGKSEDDNRRFDRLFPIIHHLAADAKQNVRNTVEIRAELKKIQSIAQFRTATQMEEKKMDLERRSERLKRMMDDEIFSYSKQIVDEFESQNDSKIEVMRQRVAQLRQKREEEDKIIVNAKLEQSFQNSCEQLRTLRVKKQAKEIAKDWEEQIKMKERLECEEEENDRLYDYLWLKDSENKFKLEQASACSRKASLKTGLKELNEQMEFKRAQAALQSKVRQMEIAENERIEREMEDEKKRMIEEKHARYLKAKEHAKEMMATKEYYKNRRIKREEIVALEFLKNAVRELYIQEADRSKAKRELMRSITIYREYLRNRDCLANSREMELQKIVDNVIEEQYQKVNETRRREKAKRRQLFCNVMKGRAEQVQELKLKREQEEVEYKSGVQKLKDEWKQYLRELDDEKVAKATKKQVYRQTLDCQTQYKNVRQDREVAEFQREAELSEMQELFFTNKLHKTIYQSKDVQSNPFRTPLEGKHIKQCLRPV